MNKLLILILIPFYLVFISSCKNKQQENIKPNIIYILADDLGYGDLGCYGQNRIETPNIDQLAQNGMKFTQHYSGSPVCAPSRCVLLTGKHTGHSYIRGNDEWRERGEVWSYEAMIKDSTLEGQRPIPGNTVTLAKLLKEAGYKTGAVGKWGLGAPHTDGIPNQQGFDFFFGYNCQRMAHTFYPTHLYKNENRYILNNDTLAPHTGLNEGEDPYDPASYEKFSLEQYAPDVMFNELISFIDQNKEQPFYLYWASPIPHVPLQAPEEWVNYYVEKFGKEEPYLGENGYYPARYPRATYAAMISYLDANVGKLVQRLEDLGIYENTIIIFSSDNGPTFNGGTDSPWFDSAGPFMSEKGWGKAFLHEGGIRVPMIASWPDRIKKGSETNHISAFWDVLPTFCELAGAEIPENIDGISFLPVLLGKKDQKKHDYLYWEFNSNGGQQAVRMGKWKAIREDIHQGNLSIKLFDLENDIQEQNDVSGSNTEIVKKVEIIMNHAHEKSALERFQLQTIDK